MHSPLVVFISVWIDDVPDETVVMATVCRARVHCDTNEVILIAPSDLWLTLFPKTWSRQQTV